MFLITSEKCVNIRSVVWFWLNHARHIILSTHRDTVKLLELYFQPKPGVFPLCWTFHTLVRKRLNENMMHTLITGELARCFPLRIYSWPQKHGEKKEKEKKRNEKKTFLCSGVLYSVFNHRKQERNLFLWVLFNKISQKMSLIGSQNICRLLRVVLSSEHFLFVQF